jgi:hypothetical protein
MNIMRHNRQFIWGFWLFTGIIFLPLIMTAQISEFNYATGQVKGRNFVGGLLGRVAEKEAMVGNSFARGSVTGTAQVGGLAGSNAGTIRNGYSTGKVTGSENAGGLVGLGSGSVTGSYWDIQTSSQSTSAGGAGRNSDPMVYPYASDTYSGWDFVSTWKADQAPFRNNGYPLLEATDLFQITVQVYPPGAGTVSGEGYYLSGQQAQLGVSADNRYVFKGWMKNSDLLATGPQYSLKVTQETSLIARFESKTTAVRNDLWMHSPKLKIYPNPVKDILWVDFSSLKEEVTVVCLANMSGQTIKTINARQKGFSQISIDVSGLNPGVYIIHALQANGYCSDRFVKY